MKHEQPEEKKVLGFSRSALIETFLYLGAVCSIDYFFFDGSRFIDSSFHPFWIIVLLITVQYGRVEGLMAAFVATAALYINNIPIQQIHETSFEWHFKLMKLPFGWFVAAFILGGIRSNLQNQIDVLRGDYIKVRTQAEAITDAFHQLKLTKENLERRLAGQVNTITTAYQSFKVLENLKPGHLIASLEGLLKSSLNAQKFSVFVHGESGFEAVTCSGWLPEEKYLRRFPNDHTLTKVILEEKRLLSSINIEDEAILEDEGVIVAPLINPTEGNVFGLIKIEEIDLLDFDISSLEILKTLSELIGSAYANAIDLINAKKVSIYSHTNHLLSYPLYKIQLKSLSAFVEESGLPLSQVKLTVNFVKHASKEESKKILFLLLVLIEEMIPEDAHLFNGKKEGHEFLILLPFVKEKDAEKLILSLVQSVEGNPEMDSLKLVFKAENVNRKTLVDLV